MPKAREKRLTWKTCIDGYEDVGLCEGVTVGEAICKLADIEEAEHYSKLVENDQFKQWVPVTERLPEYADGHVLVTDGERVKISCRNAFYNTATGETRCAQGYGAGMSVTHWMPLPQPPKENKCAEYI